MLEFVTENLVLVVIIGIVIVMTFIGYLAEKTDFGRKGIEKRELRAKRKAEEKEKAKQERIEKEIQKEKELAEKRNSKEELVPEEPKKETKKGKKRKKDKDVEIPVVPVVPEYTIPITVESEIAPNTESMSIGQETIEDLSAPLEPLVIPIVPTVEDASIPVEVFDPIASEPQVIQEATPVTIEPEMNPVMEENPIEVLIPESVILDNEPLEQVEVMEVNPTLETDKMPQDISTIIPATTPLPDISTLQNNPNNDEEVLEEDDVWKF